MILADTSIWVDHLRGGEPALATALSAARVWLHPFVMGELACGNLSNRHEILKLLGALPVLPVASADEVLAFLDFRDLMGRGLGYVDVHLLASVVLSGTVRLWTRDRRLAEVADELGVGGATLGPSPSLSELSVRSSR